MSATESESTGVVSASAGELRLLDFESRIFRNSRTLRVWLPPGYNDSGNVLQLYPVLYLNDGQNLFDSSTAFAGVDWQVHKSADRLIAEGIIPPLIIVGIDHARQDRLKEYVPYRAFNLQLLRPLGERYPDFLVNEVMPFLETRFRIAREPAKTGLGGSSLGGLISLYTVITRPGVFGRLLVESPSLFVGNRKILNYSRRFRQWPGKIFLGIGTREHGRVDRDGEFVDDVRRLKVLLLRAGLDNTRLRVKIEEGATHGEAEWARRFPEALSFLYGKQD